MTNNFDNEENKDDLTDADIAAGEEQPKAAPTVSDNLAEAWRTKPMFKFMVLIVAVFAVGAAAVNFFGTGNKSSEMARLARPPSIKEAPGGDLSPFMKEQTELANKERSEQAIATGGSALPTPVGKTAGGFVEEDRANDATLAQLRAETEALKKQVAVQQAQQQVQQRQNQQQPQQFDASLAQAMQRQMQELLESWTPRGMKSITVSDRNESPSGNGAVDASMVSNAVETRRARRALVNAGTVSYAQLLTEANSDVPGPIMVQIVSGPLTGARAIGSFQVSDGYEKYLVLRFSLADKAGKSYQINAVALDPDTTLGGMATEVDERYFTRVVLPAAAGFLQGLGQSMGQGNSSITTNGTTTISTVAGSGFRQGMYNGLGQAAQTAGQFFQDQANKTKPLVRVAAGTPMGIFFVAPVYDTEASGVETNIGAPANYGYNDNAGNTGTGLLINEGQP